MANVIEFIIDGKNKSGPAFGKLDKSLAGIRGGLDGITRHVFSLKGALAGLGLGVAAKSFIDAANTSENLKTRLRVLTGSVAEGNRMFQNMSQYASEVPFEFEEIMQSATQLAGIMDGNVDEVNEWIPRIGDLAAATGFSIQETTEQVQRMLSAGAAAADRFRERGVTQMLGFTAGVSYSAEQTKSMLIDALEGPQSRIAGATKLLATNLTGLMSMLADKWFQFRNVVMDSGILNFIKAIVTVFNKDLSVAMEKVKQNSQSFVEGFMTAFHSAIFVIGTFLDGLHAIGIIWDTLLLGVYHFAQGAIQTFNQIASVIPGMEATAISFLDNIAEKTKEVQEGMLATLPSEALKSKAEEIKKVYHEIAAAQAAAAAGGQEGGDPNAPLEKSLQDKIALIRQYMQIESDIGAEDYEKKVEASLERRELDLERLKIWNEEDLISDAEHTLAKEEAEQAHLLRMMTLQKKAGDWSVKFAKMTGEQKSKTLIGELQKATAGAASENKRMFKMNQSLAIADTVMSTYSSAQKVFEGFSSIPIIGSVLGAIAAGIVVAGGLARVSKIRSQKFEGGAAHGGLTNVPRESTFLLDEGERVLSPNQNADLTSFLDQQQTDEDVADEEGGAHGDIYNVEVHILENATDVEALLSMDRDDIETLVEEKIVPAFNDLGRKGIKPDYLENVEGQ